MRHAAYNPVRRRGFATIVAITMIGLVGVALLAISALFAADVRRTGRAAGEAQLRQMLVAGADVACQHSRHWGDHVEEQSSSINLPPSLRQQRAMLQMQTTPAGDGQSVTVSVDARLDQQHAQQSLRFIRRDSGWQLTEAVLEPSAPQ